MPIYEYRCAACGAELERLQKISDPLLTDCPACGKPALSRLISASSFRLKGSGWYETDFKSSGKRHLADSGAAGGSTADAGSDKAPAGAETASRTETAPGGKPAADTASGPASA